MGNSILIQISIQLAINLINNINDFIVEYYHYNTYEQLNLDMWSIYIDRTNNATCVINNEKETANY